MNWHRVAVVKYRHHYNGGCSFDFFLEFYINIKIIIINNSNVSFVFVVVVVVVVVFVQFVSSTVVLWCAFLQNVSLCRRCTYLLLSQSQINYNQLYQTKCITDSMMQFRKRMFMLFNAGSATLVHSFILSNYVIRSNNFHGGFRKQYS